MNYRKIVKYLLRMQEDCIMQTGCEPCIADYEGIIESDEFVEKFGKLSIDDLMNYLIIELSKTL